MTGQGARTTRSTRSPHEKRSKFCLANPQAACLEDTAFNLFVHLTATLYFSVVAHLADILYCNALLKNTARMNALTPPASPPPTC